MDYENWFEFGIDDWSSDKTKEENIKKVLDKTLLKWEVESFSVNDDMDIFVVYLKEKSDK